MSTPEAGIDRGPISLGLDLARVGNGSASRGPRWSLSWNHSKCFSFEGLRIAGDPE